MAEHALLADVDGVVVPTGHLIGGAWVGAPTTFESRSPLDWDGMHLADVARGDAATADAAAAAAVEGFALAGGLEVALTCDLLVAAEGVKLGIPEVGVGLLAAGGALMRLPRRVPYQVAMKMALTADPITAEEALGHGLVVEVTAKGGTVDAAMALAERIAENAPLSVALSKQMVLNQQGLTEEEFWEMQKPSMAQVFRSEDAIEGATAFAEKRKPQWKGR